MESKFSLSTDTKHKITLESAIVRAIWIDDIAYAGSNASFEIVTSLVGEGAKIKVKAESEFGIDLGQVKGLVYGNRFRGEFKIPEDIEIGDKAYFTVKLPKHGLEDESDHILLEPPVIVSEMKWSRKEVRHSDNVDLTAYVEGAYDETEAKITIYEQIQEGIRDIIATIATRIKNGKAEITWLYENYEDLTENKDQKGGNQIKNSREYFFVIEVGNYRFGDNRESGLLVYKGQSDVLNGLYF